MKPIPRTGQPIRCGYVFNADDLTRLREGLWPRDMDDRWAVHLDGDSGAAPIAAIRARGPPLSLPAELGSLGVWPPP